jgi:hypothetical protein
MSMLGECFFGAIHDAVIDDMIDVAIRMTLRHSRPQM